MIMQLSAGSFTADLGFIFTIYPALYMVMLTKIKVRNNQNHSIYLEDEIVDQKSLIYNKILNNFQKLKRQLENKKQKFTWTWVSALLVDTSLGSRTLSIQNTFRFTSHQRISNVSAIHTFTNCSTI